MHGIRKDNKVEGGGAVSAAKKEMTPEEYFAAQRTVPLDAPKRGLLGGRIRIEDRVPKAEEQLPLAAAPRLRKRTVMDEAELVKAQVVRKAPPAPLELAQEPKFDLEDKVSLLAKSQVYIVWVMTMLLSAVLIFVGVLYPFPMNIAVFAVAIGMIGLSMYTMRKYMRF